jgi:uncharacterized membrane protein
MGKETFYVFMSIYKDVLDAEVDMETVRRLHKEDALGSYDAAVAWKDEVDDVKIRKREVPREHGAWWGVAAGSVVGLLFPPSVLAMGVAGGGLGAILGHFGRGLSRIDVKQLGELLDEGQAALVVVAVEPVTKPLVDAGMRSGKYMEKEMLVDPKQLDYHFEEVQKELAGSGES